MEVGTLALGPGVALEAAWLSPRLGKPRLVKG